jgi:uronate dehydrogenase
MSNILITGSSGAVARAICPDLIARGHTLRGFDRTETPGIRDMIVDRIEDRGVVARAMQGMDAVIHLAAEPNDADFPLLVGPNVIGLFNVMDAARITKVKRVVLASSIQVLSWRSRGNSPVSVQDASPGNHYGLTKLWAEKMGEMYARHYGLSVLVVRIAWLVRNQTEAMRMLRNPRPHLYLSARDAGRFFVRAVEAQDIEFAIVYAGSRGAELAFDMEPAREVLGYVAQDTWPNGLDFELPEIENQN